MGRCVHHFEESKNGKPSDVVHGTRIEVVWTIVPARRLVRRNEVVRVGGMVMQTMGRKGEGRYPFRYTRVRYVLGRNRRGRTMVVGGRGAVRQRRWKRRRA